jgi:hypothetical protein
MMPTRSRDAPAVEFPEEVGDDGLEPGALDREAEVPDRGVPEVGFLEGEFGLLHGWKITEPDQDVSFRNVIGRCNRLAPE